eukprot:2444743-Amphidinium_carterae.1
MALWPVECVPVYWAGSSVEHSWAAMEVSGVHHWHMGNGLRFPSLVLLCATLQPGLESCAYAVPGCLCSPEVRASSSAGATASATAIAAVGICARPQHSLNTSQHIVCLCIIGADLPSGKLSMSVFTQWPGWLQ